jgi:hypothetical protein
MKIFKTVITEGYIEEIRCLNIEIKSNNHSGICFYDICLNFTLKSTDSHIPLCFYYKIIMYQFNVSFRLFLSKANGKCSDIAVIRYLGIFKTTASQKLTSAANFLTASQMPQTAIELL